MKKIVDPVAIKDVATYTKNKLDELENAKNILRDDINNIRKFYKGADAELIIDKYLDRLKVIDVIINNYSNLKEYFSSISAAYSNCLKKAKTSMDNINSNFIISDNIDNNVSNIENTTLTIDL
ncbi:MAG: hypothetical protein IJ068_01795 [Bacilli bacterium]|nr:hypothetical protein [Bacilli bacterium]